MTLTPEPPYHHGDLREALVREALAMLEEAGPDELSLRGLAAAVGVSRGAPYAHFPDKAALLAAVAGTGFGRLAEAMVAGAVARSTARERFLAVGRAYVRFALANPNLFKLMSATGGRPRSEAQLLADKAGPYGIFSAALDAHLKEAGGSDDDMPAVRAAAWSCVHGLAALILEQRLPLPTGGADAVIDRVTTLFADLLALRS